jgi:hypothetical protein
MFRPPMLNLLLIAHLLNQFQFLRTLCNIARPVAENHHSWLK